MCVIFVVWNAFIPVDPDGIFCSMKKKHVNITDSFLAFDLLTLSHLVTAVTFHMTFCVWLTITVNNIARKQDIKVNKMFTRMLENKWKNERIWNEEEKKNIEDKEECHWEQNIHV